MVPTAGDTRGQKLELAMLDTGLNLFWPDSAAFAGAAFGPSSLVQQETVDQLRFVPLILLAVPGPAVKSNKTPFSPKKSPKSDKSGG